MHSFDRRRCREEERLASKFEEELYSCGCAGNEPLFALWQDFLLLYQTIFSPYDEEGTRHSLDTNARVLEGFPIARTARQLEDIKLV